MAEAPSLTHLRIAVEVDGPSRFTSNTRQLLNTTLYRRRCLEARGWTVVSVPYWRWRQEADVSFERQEALIRVLLKEAGVELGKTVVTPATPPVVVVPAPSSPSSPAVTAAAATAAHYSAAAFSCDAIRGECGTPRLREQCPGRRGHDSTKSYSDTRSLHNALATHSCRICSPPGPTEEGCKKFCS